MAALGATTPAVRAALAAVALLAAAALLAGPAEGRGHPPPLLGIGDQHAAMFDHPRFPELGVRTFRYLVPWSVRVNERALARADAFVAAARRHSGRVLMHVTTDEYRPRRGLLPSRRLYRREIRWLVRRYRPQGVVEWGAWNEANHISQPTYRDPNRAAAYFRELYHACPGCRIVALDVLDQIGVERYIDRFYRALGPVNTRRARVLGVHNYIDVNRRRSESFTRRIIRAGRRHNRSSTFWLTETGGLVSRPHLTCSVTRGGKRLRAALRLAVRLRRIGVTRAYPYHWTGSGCDARFDSGITEPGGRLRPGYYVLREEAARFRR